MWKKSSKKSIYFKHNSSPYNKCTDICQHLKKEYNGVMLYVKLFECRWYISLFAKTCFSISELPFTRNKDNMCKPS